MDNGRLRKIFNDHYNEKSGGTSLNKDEILRLRENRYKTLKRMVKTGQLKTDTDYLKAALLYQDVGSLRGSLKARKLADKGVSISGNRSKWLSLTSRYGGTQNSLRGFYQNKFGRAGRNSSQSISKTNTSHKMDSKNRPSSIRRPLKF